MYFDTQFRLFKNTVLTLAPPILSFTDFSITLPDGTQVRFVPIGPEHKEHIREGFQRLSQASRYMRFGHPVNELSERELQYLTQVDQQYHIAWGALINEQGTEHGVGVGRYIHIGENIGKDEFELTIIDAYQNKGIGHYLLALLYVLALRQGIHTLSGSILPTNGHAAEIMTSIGASITVENGLYYANLPVLADWAQLTSPYGQKFAQSLALIQQLLHAPVAKKA